MLLLIEGFSTVMELAESLCIQIQVDLYSLKHKGYGTSSSFLHRAEVVLFLIKNEFHWVDNFEKERHGKKATETLLHKDGCYTGSIVTCVYTRFLWAQQFSDLGLGSVCYKRCNKSWNRKRKWKCCWHVVNVIVTFCHPISTIAIIP